MPTPLTPIRPTAPVAPAPTPAPTPTPPADLRAMPVASGGSRPKAGKSKLPLIIFIVLLAFVLGAAAGYAAAKLTDKESKTNKAATVAPAADTATKIPALKSRVVAVGIPGAGPLAVVGTFLPGGPINDKPELKATTAAGRILDPSRVLVGSASNFGAPIAQKDRKEGSLLSIDLTSKDVLKVPADFAKSGKQEPTLGGRVQLFSAQSPAFINAIRTPAATTAALAGVSNPLDLSLNNGFGRIWPANADLGLSGEGSASILDPDGAPLAGAPSKIAGGVFAGNKTERKPTQLVSGDLITGAVGTALLGRSPDKSTRAVFAIVQADGSILQAHSEQNVDGLAPTTTISDLRKSPKAAELHAGVVLKYYGAKPTLYISDPVKNEIVSMELATDSKVFKPGQINRYKDKAFDMPVDMAPTTPESTQRDWSSNTTLAELSDIYVLNRGNNSITRMKVDGTIIATYAVTMPDGKDLGAAKVNGIATSVDGTKIFVSVTGKLTGQTEEGGLLELPAFTK